MRTIAPAVVLLLAYLAMRSEGPRAFLRVLLTMWVHEIGHAITAWLCGYGAFPGPWMTPVSESRLTLVTILLVLGLGAWGAWAWRQRRWATVGGVGSVLLLALVLTLGVRAYQARALIVFGGDAGLFVLGAAGVIAFAVAPGSVLHRTGLRWGFLIIGACAFMDGRATWSAARQDQDAIPYGEIEGVGASDPSRLTGEFGWSERTMVRRYVVLSRLGLLVIAVAYGVGIARAPATRRSPDA